MLPAALAHALLLEIASQGKVISPTLFECSRHYNPWVEGIEHIAHRRMREVAIPTVEQRGYYSVPARTKTGAEATGRIVAHNSEVPLTLGGLGVAFFKPERGRRIK